MPVEYKLKGHYIREYTERQVCLNDGTKELKHIEIYSDELGRFVGKFYNFSDIKKCIEKMNNHIREGRIT